MQQVQQSAHDPADMPAVALPPASLLCRRAVARVRCFASCRVTLSVHQGSSVAMSLPVLCRRAVTGVRWFASCRLTPAAPRSTPAASLPPVPCRPAVAGVHRVPVGSQARQPALPGAVVDGHGGRAGGVHQDGGTQVQLRAPPTRPLLAFPCCRGGSSCCAHCLQADPALASPSTAAYMC